MFMPTVSASLQKGKALANNKLMSNGMIEISPDENATSLPLDIVMVLDISGSMGGTGIQVVIDSVVHLQSMLSANDRMAIITFNSNASLHSDWVTKGDFIPEMKASGGTNFNAAVKELLSFIGSRGGDSNRAGIALFMSDGHPAGNQHAKDDDLQAVTSFGYTMHCIGVTAGVNPDHLEHMAEMARGRYFSAPTFPDVKDKFTQLFKFGKTIWYSAPTIELNISNGVTLSEVMEVNGLDLCNGQPLTSGAHTLSLANFTQGMKSQISFKIEADMINQGANQLATVKFENLTANLQVEGVSDTTILLNAPVNNSVTVSRTTAQATKALKTGDQALATKLLTKLDTIGKTVPNASETSTILKTIVGETNKGTVHETIGKVAVDTKGKTVTRKD